ncbi:MAG: hypothetical protein ACYDD1_22245 [Caulobacteraceae bacterium]
MITPDDIRAEHEAAIAALSPEQGRAIERRDQVKRFTVSRGGAAAEHMLEIFMAEAAARSVVS